MWPFMREKLVVPPRPRTVCRDAAEPMPVPERHFVNRHPLAGPYPDGMQKAVFGLGCFWGAERVFWQAPGCGSPRSAMPAARRQIPTYEEVCSGRTGHTEAVLVVYDPKADELRGVAQAVLGEPRPDPGHAPGQRRRHAIPLGDLYLLAGAAAPPPRRRAQAYQGRLDAAGLGKITTEIREAPPFYFAEGYHQQYLAKNPNGYCGLGGTGVACPMPATVAAA